MPFRPKRSDTQTLDVGGPDLGDEKRQLNGAPDSAPDAGSHIVANLEAKVNGTEAKGE